MNIGLAIKKHNAARAGTFVDELYDRCRQIGDMPHAYPLISGHESSGIRRRVHRNYLIFFRIEADRVEIVHVLHGAMDYRTLLFPED